MLLTRRSWHCTCTATARPRPSTCTFRCGQPQNSPNLRYLLSTKNAVYLAVACAEIACVSGAEDERLSVGRDLVQFHCYPSELYMPGGLDLRGIGLSPCRFTLRRLMPAGCCADKRCRVALAGGFIFRPLGQLHCTYLDIYSKGSFTSRATPRIFSTYGCICWRESSTKQFFECTAVHSHLCCCAG